MPLLRRLLALLLLLAAPAAAQLGGGAEHLHPQLIAERGVPAGGGTVELAVAFAPEPGWHGYWKNPGDAGTPTTIAWTLPPGVTVDPPRYPVPGTLLLSGLMNYVYEAPYALLATLHAPAGAPVPLRIAASLDFLACTRDICVPQHAEVATALPAGATDPATRVRFDAWRAALPKPLGSGARIARAGDRVRLAIPLPATLAVAGPYVFPADDGVIDYAAPQSITRNGDAVIVEAKAAAGSAVPARLDGVLRIAPGQGLAFAAVPGEVPAAGAPIDDGDAAGRPWLGAALVALAGAFLGGLILNVMPCVFPILSLKALSLARGGGEHARAEAIAYACGVVLVCVALGALLLGLRASGAAVGWAFQLQDPRVILALLLLVIAIALNLAGLFELASIDAGGGLAARGGTSGAFWTGALAAFIATPCTGPFMGAALGAALVLPAAAALAIFAGLGLGLAAPFLAIGFSARLRRWLPRPGGWMETFRRILAVPMLLTAVGLAWVLGRQAGVDGMALGLAAALFLALGLWWTGARQRRGGGAAWTPALVALALSLGAAVLLPRAAPATARTRDTLASEPFSEARLAALRGEGRPVFVYFTADWCLTCKVNEKAAIERGEVADAFRAAHVATLVGDWTGGDPAIGRFLAAHGRSGVPLYLFYAPGKAEQVLPQILTPGTLTALAAR